MDTIHPRLQSLGADMTRIVALEGITEIDTETGEPFERCFTIQDIMRLDEAIEATPECRLVVIDPISAFLGRDVDSHRDADVRSILRPLADLAQRRHIAILIVAHHSKGAGKAVYRTMGSLAFNAAARSVLAVVKDPDDPARRLLIPVKNNLAPDAVGLSYTLVCDSPGAHPFVRWDPTPVTATADELMGGGGDADRAIALAEARTWLQQTLSDGPVRAKDLLAAANDENISKRTLTRAKSDMNVRSVKRPDGWYWELQECQECQECETPDVAPLASLAPEQLFNESEAVDSAAEGASDDQA